MGASFVCALISGCFSTLEEDFRNSPNGGSDTDASVGSPALSDESDTETPIDTTTDGGSPIVVPDAGVGPRIVDTDPPQGASSVALNADFSIRFDRDITAGEGNVSIHESINHAEVEAAPVDDPRVTIDGDELTVRWDAMLAPATGYYVLLEPGAIEDNDGNAFVGLTQPEQYSFTTRTPQALQLVDTVPNDGDTNVPRTRSLRLSFNEPIVAGLEGNITIVEAESMDIFEVIPVTDEVRVTVSDDRVTIDPTGVFRYGTEYYVQVDPGTVQSTGGSTFEGITPGAFSFTTVAPPPLELVGTVPADDAADVDPATSLVLTFADALTTGEGAVVVHRADDDSVVEVANVGDANVIVSGVTLSVDLTSDLDTNTEYYVTVDTGVVRSELGAAFEGIADTTSLSFTTAGNAAPPLVVLASLPEPDAVEVPMNAQLTMVFSEAVTVGTGVISVFAYDDDDLVDTIDVTSTNQVSVDTDTVDVTLGFPLEGSTKYYVTVSAGSFESGQGASFAGISGKDTWPFTTELVFGLADIRPNDDAVGVNPSTNLVLTFTEDVAIGTGDVELRAAADNALIEAVAIDDSRVTVEGDTITVNLDNILGSEVDYYVVVDGSAVSALAGDTWGGVNDATTWNFTTDAVEFPSGSGSGLVLWLDAMYPQSLKSNGGVYLWADRSGRYRNARQGSSGEQPERISDAINGNAAVHFDGNDELRADSINLAAFDGFIVWQSNLAASTSVKSSLLANDKNTEVNHGHPFGGARNAAASCVGSTCPQNTGWYDVRFEPAPQPDQPSLWNWGFDAITTTLYVRSNGSAPINDTGPTMTPWLPESPLLIGNCTDATCGFTGDIGEIILYSRTLTATERVTTISYLRNKWGLNDPTCDAAEALGPNGSCYFLGTDSVDWDTARTNCRARGRGWDLATIRSSDAHAFVATLLQQDTAIGATDAAVDGTWRWVTDSLQFWSGDEAGMATNSAFTAWDPAQPTAGNGESCARYFKNADNEWVWADNSCANAHHYLCEGPAN